VLYIAELKKEQKPFTPVFDGRGVVKVNVAELLARVSFVE
jgi:hypothetical protein